MERLLPAATFSRTSKNPQMQLAARGLSYSSRSGMMAKAYQHIEVAPARYSICNSNGLELHLNGQLYEEFKAKERALFKEMYAKQRELFGIWAGNQAKFVKDASELGEFDSKFMEELHNGN
jgi:hypothetical protein